MRGFVAGVMSRGEGVPDEIMSLAQERSDFEFDSASMDRVE